MKMVKSSGVLPVSLYLLGALVLASIYSVSGSQKSGSLKQLANAVKCLVPNGLEHAARTLALQQCISRNYAQGNETVCYNGLGCFAMESPWVGMFRPFPSPHHPAVINTRFYFYNRDSEHGYNATGWPEPSLGNCEFDPSKPTMFLVHGFATHGEDNDLRVFKKRYLSAVDANVFIVDWGQGAQILNYLQVASNTRIVGGEVSMFIEYLRDEYGLDPKQVHLIGHGLGAQICSYVGKRVHGIGHLTALDPAGPGFERQDSKVRLDKSDATFVDVVHSNAVPFLPPASFGFGMVWPHGHVDFYMNGGLFQPSCITPDVSSFLHMKSLKDLISVPVEVIAKYLGCSHKKAFYYYMEVLSPNCYIWGRKSTFVNQAIDTATGGFLKPLADKFKKCTADTCIPLSLETKQYQARGTFSASTSLSSPYCEHNPEVNRKIKEEIRQSQSGDDKGFVDRLKDKWGFGRMQRNKIVLQDGSDSDTEETDERE